MKRTTHLSLFAFLLLSACYSPSFIQPLGPSQQPLSLAIPSLTISGPLQLEEDKSGAWLENSMTTQCQRWFERRFKASSGTEAGRITIEQASLKNLFSPGGKEQYEAILSLRFDIPDSLGFSKSFAAANVRRTTKILDHPTQEERKDALQELVNLTLLDIDAEFIRSLKAYLPLIMMEQTGS